MKYSSLLSLLLIVSALTACTAPALEPPSSATPTVMPTLTAIATPPAASWDGLANPALWQGGSDYLLEARQGVLFVQANKISPNASMEAVFPPLDVRAAPYASVTALSDISANITVGLVDANGNESWLIGNYANREMAHGAHPLTHFFDFSRASIDLSRVTAMRITCNRGGPSCRANFQLRAIRLGANVQPVLAYAPLPDVDVVVGDDPLPVVPFPLSRDDAAETWRAEFPAQLVASGEFRDGAFHYTLTGQPGTGKVTLIGQRGARSVELAFALSVSANRPPRLPQTDDQMLAVGDSLDLRLTGLDDGDPASAQAMTLSAVSADPSIVAVTGIEHNARRRWAVLSLRAETAGKTEIILTLTDDRGASVSQSFAVSVFAELNRPPSFDLPATLALPAGGELQQLITNISAGEPNQRVTFTVQTDQPGLTARIENDTLILRADPALSSDTRLTVTATDDGGNPRNQGNASISHEVIVRLLPSAITGFNDPFDGPEVAPSLTGSGEGAHALSIEDGALRVEVDKYLTNNPWAGLWYTLPAELDLTQNPVITLRMKADRPTAMLIFLWDADDRYNTAGTATVIVDTEWKAYTLDFSGKNLDSQGRTVDFSRIKALLFNFAPGQMYRGTVWLDDMRVGTEAAVRAAPPALVIQSPPRLTLLPGSAAAETLRITGLLGDETIELIDATPGLVREPRLTPQGEGRFLLTLKTAPDTTGLARLKVTVLAPDGRRSEKFIDILIPNLPPADLLTLDRATRYQVIDGFGAFLGAGVWARDRQDLNLPFVQDLNITVARFGIIDTDFEPRNDNANPYVIDFDAFERSALPLDWMRRLKAESAIDKYILTVWSPPDWMKKGRTRSAITGSGENFVEERYYEEYAEFLAALVHIVKEETDIDLYAISVQNEPQFNQPYASALLPADKMAQVLAVVSRRFATEGIQTKLFMPEALPQQQGIGEYIRQLDLIPEAGQGTDIIAIHNYDSDGINVGGAGAQEWADMYRWANAARPRRMWMTETSGHPNTWTGATLLFGNMYNALAYGNASAWVWWTLADTSGNAQYGLVVDNQPTARYAVSRHFYRAIQPGAVRIQVNAPDNLLALAFENPDRTTAIVLYNKGKARLVACPEAGTLTEAWLTHEGLFSRPAQVSPAGVLLPADAVMTLVFEP
ncbi:glycoside hydrolase family 30 beta sandwich domain-containing protein [Roseiflexus sp.]|uniref:glycoside hydrolase family 30 beta sandwich domain-containing protein n=1 Tax=Roseiflexus sp. TaxID=2562120 RepID=UPI00398B98D6